MQNVSRADVVESCKSVHSFVGGLIVRKKRLDVLRMKINGLLLMDIMPGGLAASLKGFRKGY